MKRYFISLILMALCIACKAQEFSFSALAGVNYSSFFPDQQGLYPSSRKSKAGYEAGILAGIKKNHLDIEVGGIFEQFNSENSYTETSPGGYGNGIFSYSVRYLQIPLNIFYVTKTSIGKLFLGGGPFVSFGLSGNITNSSTGVNNGGFASSTTTITPYQFNSFAPYRKTDNPDYGLKLKAGLFVLNKLSLALTYDHGMRYLYNGTDGYSRDFGLKNDVFSVSLGYTIF